MPELAVVTTEANVEEVREYIPVFARRYALTNEFLLNTLAILPIVVCGEHEYVAGLARARQLLADRDPDDVALAALALTREIPVWTNDRDFTGFPTGVYTTAQLLKSFGM
jgi:predicted nucleic acid-binding protein